MLEWVIDAARESAGYISRPNTSRHINANVYLLIPAGDKIKDEPAFNKKAQIIEGSEFDVLSRYKSLLDVSGADYVIRITGDCPLIPAPVITKALNVAMINRFDYVSNVDERLRLSFDGMDCEIMSARLLKYINEHAWTSSDREHVTTFVRSKDCPKNFSSAHIVGYLDLSSLKLSVDTEEDLENVRKQKSRVLEALRLSREISGIQATHRF